LLCHLSFELQNQDVVNNPSLVLAWAYTTHKDIKDGWSGAMADVYFFSNNRAVQTVLEDELLNGFHWAASGPSSDGPRTRSMAQQTLRFHDTDSNDWSQTAENMIDLLLAGRIWRVDCSSNDVDDFLENSGLY
jgi:hypothetical protein